MKKMVLCIVLILAEAIIVAKSITTQDHSITIFVHGTYFMRKVFHYSPYRHLMYCPDGLTLVKYLPKHYHFYKIAHGCVTCDYKNYSLDQFYVFGWDSEHINDRARNNAAKILVEEIMQIVVDYYIEHDVIPKIRLIGYSHGGNVVLHTANYIPMYADLADVAFEAWLFGTPVQAINHDLVNSESFDTIYSIYSTKDIVQKMDPQGLRNRNVPKNSFWSERTFHESSRCIQVNFTVNGDSISHSFYNEIFQYFPKIKKIIEEKSNHLQSGTILVDFLM